MRRYPPTFCYYGCVVRIHPHALSGWALRFASTPTRKAREDGAQLRGIVLMTVNQVRVGLPQCRCRTAHTHTLFREGWVGKRGAMQCSSKAYSLTQNVKSRSVRRSTRGSAWRAHGQRPAESLLPSGYEASVWRSRRGHSMVCAMLIRWPCSAARCLPFETSPCGLASTGGSLMRARRLRRSAA